MRRHLGLAITLLLTTAALAGCGKSTKPASPLGAAGGANGGASAVDVAQVNDAVAANPVLVNEDQFAVSTPATFSAAPAGAFAAIQPLRWWRTIDSTSRSMNVVYGTPDSLGHPTTAIATITRRLIGRLTILSADSLPPDSGTAPAQITRKPIADTWVRQLALKRFPRDTASADSLPHWRIVGTSGVEVTSDNATTHIQSIHIVSGARDTTITDPLELRRLKRIMWLHSMAPVHITVTTGRASDIVFLYRSEERRHFKNNGDGTFSIDFVTGDFGGLRHFGVNAFSAGTLLDDAAPYDSQAWIVPFGARDGDCDVDHHR
jgi:hypothetical protein